MLEKNAPELGVESARLTVVIRKQGVAQVVESFTVTQPTTGSRFEVKYFLSKTFTFYHFQSKNALKKSEKQILL